MSAGGRGGAERCGTAAPGLGGASLPRQPELRGAGPALRGSSPPHAPHRAPPRRPRGCDGLRGRLGAVLECSSRGGGRPATRRLCPPPVGKVTFRFASPPRRCANRSPLFVISPLLLTVRSFVRGGGNVCVGPPRASSVLVKAGAERSEAPTAPQPRAVRRAAFGAPNYAFNPQYVSSTK